MSYIKTVVVFDGQKEYENEEVLNIPEFKKYYDVAHTFYYGFIDKINECESAYLFIDCSERPNYKIKGSSEYLESILPK